MQGSFTAPSIITFQRGVKNYELSNHLGNVLATISDKKTGFSSNGTTIDNFTADVRNATDYYPFGMQEPGRTFTTLNIYRYGFNGQESDNEIKGQGNTYTAAFWEYDSRSGRRWNLDPKPSVSMSSYSTFFDNPILFNDNKGDSSVFGSHGETLHYDKKDKDLRVFMLDGKKLTQIGVLGETINVNVIVKNILNDNKKASQDYELEDWFNKVKQDAPWDYKDDNKSGKDKVGTIFGTVWHFDAQQTNANAETPHTSFIYSSWIFSSSADFGNFHAGYTGTYTGIPASWQWRGAGIAEMLKNKQYPLLFNPYTYLFEPYGDALADKIWNTRGMKQASKEIQDTKNTTGVQFPGSHISKLITYGVDVKNY